MKKGSFALMTRAACSVWLILMLFATPGGAEASYHFSNYKGKPPIHVLGTTTKSPVGMTPDEIKKIYHLPENGGKGTIVIIGAYDDTTIESDLAVFDKQFGLPACTKGNGCLEQHLMSAKESTNSGWALETSLDVEWAHAIAPNAKILLVEATTPSGTNLLNAVDYAAARNGVAAISMSWGGAEFPEEVSLDPHFKSISGALFFASSGDNGTGASWPASSPNVIGVGGTHVSLSSNGAFLGETAWSGSGGGVSAYEKEPSFQSAYNIPKAGGMRAIPDVSYDADPASGFPIYHAGKWQKVGGTSAGAPQWAAIAALGSGISLRELYADKAAQNNANYFRDITSGTNGLCGYLCTARKHYDYVTGLGSPLTTTF
ncbi:MAG TPA: S53 family peptidase [Candidatus Paceibacterota bacterium]|nr:S53 family peptidase [Candidatus Paceibacterota bacterium]